MADEGLEEKTEEASEKKLNDMRKDGKVAQSRDLVSALLMLGATATLFGSAKWVFNGISSVFESSFMEMGRLGTGDFSISTISSMNSFALKGLAYILAPLALVTVLSAFVGNLAQHGGILFTTKPMEPDLQKLSPLKGLKKIFSPEGIFEVCKATMKLILVGTILFFVFKKWIGKSTVLWNSSVSQILVHLGDRLIMTMFIVCGVMALLAVIDFGYQKFKFQKDAMMTKQEAKEERKQVDGNPQVKARIRSMQRQMATSQMLEAVKEADVIVTNPTHFAVAIVYDRENMAAPKIVAKGVDHMAQKIKKIARENGVPCVENVPLARAMYKALKIGQFISKDLYNAVAEVLAYVYRLKGRTE